MMPDLGKYAVAVLVGLSLWQAARVKRALAEVEARQGKNDG